MVNTGSVSRIRSCSCPWCNGTRMSMALHNGQKAKAFQKNLPNRNFRHKTKLAIASQRDVPESISAGIWV